jgi:regulator of sigma E protease
MVTAIIFIIILGLLIFVHELGHFVTARRNGIKAEEFGFGFPPRAFGFLRDEKTGKWKFIPGNREVTSKNTLYSINWLPLGGFVRIKGEDGMGAEEKDSFAGKGAWVKVKVLAAGVVMNFALAWLLLAVVFMVGAPEAADEAGAQNSDAKIQISEVLPNTPASVMGLQAGDEIIKNQQFQKISDVQDYISAKKGQELILIIKRGQQILELKGVPRVEAPAGEGLLGISLVETVIVSYPWYQAIWKGLLETLGLIAAMLVALFGIIKSLLVGQGSQIQVAGPVGIAILTKQFTTLGFVYLLRFAAILSVNLGIINAFPFPALDGGRILFVLIGKIKGSPISQKTEQAFNTVGFVLLIFLMILITFRDVSKLVN